MYSRLVSQKSSLCTKLLAHERHKNLTYLKRIGRFPYLRMNSVCSQWEERRFDGEVGDN